MKRKFHKTLVLISIVCILTLGISSVVFAAYATSDKKQSTVYGYTYMYSAGVSTDGTFITAQTVVSCIDQNVGMFQQDIWG